MPEHTSGPVPERIFERGPSPDPDREVRLRVLERYLTERRRQRIESTLAHRLAAVTVVFDGVYDLGNAAAVMRTCEGLGVHHVHFVESQTGYKPARRTSQGSHKWLDVQVHATPTVCADALKRDGYRLFGASLEATQTLDEVEVSGKIALVFGSESEGLCPEMVAACDELYRIEMYGMVQSFNVSVAAAITLHDAVNRHLQAVGVGPGDARGDLPAEVRDVLRELFYRKAVNNADAILLRELGVAPPPLPDGVDIFGDLV